MGHTPSTKTVIKIKKDTETKNSILPIVTTRAKETVTSLALRTKIK